MVVNVNPDFVAVPPEVVTLTNPVVPSSTIAVICVDEITSTFVAFVPPNLTMMFVPLIVGSRTVYCKFLSPPVCG